MDWLWHYWYWQPAPVWGGEKPITFVNSTCYEQVILDMEQPDCDKCCRHTWWCDARTTARDAVRAAERGRVCRPSTADDLWKWSDSLWLHVLTSTLIVCDCVCVFVYLSVDCKSERMKTNQILFCESPTWKIAKAAKLILSASSSFFFHVQKLLLSFSQKKLLRVSQKLFF